MIVQYLAPTSEEAKRLRKDKMENMFFFLNKVASLRESYEAHKYSLLLKYINFDG